MKTITVNEKTKEGKTLLELAKILSESGKDIVIETATSGEDDPIRQSSLLRDLETACQQLQEAKKTGAKRKSLDELLDEK